MKKSRLSETIKVVVIGDACTGKTSLIKRYIDHTFDIDYRCTIGVDFKRKDLIVKDKQYALYLWDTAGQEIYKNVTKSYYQNAHACLILYDITQRETFNSVESWVEQFGNNNSIINPSVVIIGNKKDLSDKRQVQLDEGKALKAKLGCMFYECSVKQSQEEIDNVFNELILDIVSKSVTKCEEPKIVLQPKINPKERGCC